MSGDVEARLAAVEALIEEWSAYERNISSDLTRNPSIALANRREANAWYIAVCQLKKALEATP